MADYDDTWKCVKKETDVIFEDNSTSITLNLPSNQNWDIIGKASPLIVSRRKLYTCRCTFL